MIGLLLKVDIQNGSWYVENIRSSFPKKPFPTFGGIGT
jgi:hypothetical protein